jgi:hypothetical protein
VLTCPTPASSRKGTREVLDRRRPGVTSGGDRAVSSKHRRLPRPGVWALPSSAAPVTSPRRSPSTVPAVALPPSFGASSAPSVSFYADPDGVRGSRRHTADQRICGVKLWTWMTPRRLCRTPLDKLQARSSSVCLSCRYSRI